MKLFYLFFLFALIWGTPVFAEEILVGLEPFPPLITEDKNGYSVDMLRAVEKISDLKFNIQIMPYSRAKVALEKKQIDLMGHTPYKNEEPAFYNYAEELNWNIASSADLFVMDKKYFDLNLLKNHSIGTPFGNTGFHASVLKIPIDKFTETHLENLVAMLERGRIEALIFERASTMSAIQKLKIPNIYYQASVLMPTSLAVTKDRKGLKLKQKLDLLIKQVNQQKIFQAYFHYLKMPASGVVPIK